MKRSRSVSSSAASYVTAADESPHRHQSGAKVATLSRTVSPPPARRTRLNVPLSKKLESSAETPTFSTQPTTAQVEAGVSEVENHVDFFSAKLAAFARQAITGPRLSHSHWLELYRRNENADGHHFVIHQHDHPVAGTHYDLRLQINASSSISFAIMYGLPGDPNSRRLNRNATETRVHCLWNHLIETASPQTGTMLIWDTGEYEVLGKSSNAHLSHNSDSATDSETTRPTSNVTTSYTQPEKLAMAFSRRKMRLRLHGSRLPPGYTLYLRLTKDNDRFSQPRAPAYRRRGKLAEQPSSSQPRRASTTSTSSSNSRPPSTSEPDTDISNATRSTNHRRLRRTVSSLKRTASPPRRSRLASPSKLESMASEPVHSTGSPSKVPWRAPEDEQAAAVAVSDDDSDEIIRRNNAYPGASNTIGSIHQRKWYLSMDRDLSGFKSIPTPRDINHHAKTYRVARHDLTGAVNPRSTEPTDLVTDFAQCARGFDRFRVLGRDHERSVITGRLAADILEDEGVQGYVPRGLWRPVLE